MRALALENGAFAAEVNDGFASGGEGAAALAQAVADACEQPSEFASCTRTTIRSSSRSGRSPPGSTARKDVFFYLDAERKIAQYMEDGLDRLPICMAKTHLSLSADPALLNAPEDFTLPVRDIRAYTGAGWLVPLCGDIQQMPGLGKAPAALNVDIDEEGRTVGSVLRCRETSPTSCARTRASSARPRSRSSKRRWTSAARSRTRTAARRRAVGPARGGRLRGLDLLRRPRPAARAPARVGLHRHGVLGVGLRCPRGRGGGDARPRTGRALRRRRALARRDRVPRLLPHGRGGPRG